MAKYILLECNRLRGKSAYNNLNEDQDKFKSNWTNVVSTEGIVVNAGDTINLEQIILNSKGASDEVIEFSGDENESGFVDNKIRLEYSFYINHGGSNTARLPFLFHKTYRGNGSTLTPSQVLPGLNPLNPKNNDVVKSNATFLDITSRRCLGEIFLPPTIGTGFDVTEFYTEINKSYCGGSMITRARTNNIGSSGSGNFNGGYVANLLYHAEGGSGTGMIIRVDSVTTDGNVYGIVESWSIASLGRGYGETGQFRVTLRRLVNNDTLVDIGSIPAGTGSDGSLHTIDFFTYTNANIFSQSGLNGFDGKRFTFLKKGYTGLCNHEEAIASVTASINNDYQTIIPEASKRTKTIDLEVKEGFLTPDNLGTLITDQLHEPTYINRISNDKADFLDYNTLKFSHRDVFNNTNNIANPVIVSTPTYQPQSVNFSPRGIPDTTASYCGVRRQWYNNVAYKHPERVEALKDIFYNFDYITNDDAFGNDIMSGTVGSATGANKGDFGNLNSGDIGCRVALLNDFDTDGSGTYVLLKKHGLVITNMLWTDSNIQRIAKGFKKVEKYCGDTSLNIDTDSDNFKNNLLVNLDIGMYDDELSNQFPLNHFSNDGSGNPIYYPNQRRMFCNKNQATATNLNEKGVDFNTTSSFNTPCVGHTIKNFPESVLNDGQELSSIMVKSRFQEGFTYEKYIDTTYTKDKLNPEELFDGRTDGIFDATLTADILEEDYFIGSFTDPISSKTKNTNDCINEARLNNIACVPVFSNYSTNGKMKSKNGIPYIAFVNGIECGYTTTAFDTTNYSNPTNRWFIDRKNADEGQQLGFDPSFTRNEAVCFVSPMIGNQASGTTGELAIDDYMNVGYIGAVNPSILYNPVLSRFEISGLNTPATIGNGLLSDIPELITPNPNPEQICYKVNRIGQIALSEAKVIGDVPYSSPDVQYNQSNAARIGQFDDAQQQEGSIIDSQSGIAIENIILFDKNDNTTALSETDKDNYKLCMFDKMGFDLNQLLPNFGDNNAFFTNQFVFQNKPPTYRTGILNITKPATTGSYISSAEIQPLSVNELNLPLYDLGASANRPTEPDIEQGTITAFELPDKLNFPYYTIYSSIPSMGTDSIWIGGNDGYSKLPCMGYLTRENNIGDFYYNSEQTFQYTATKDFTLTEVETDIRLPDGTRPKLNPHSAVIYKITKNLNSLPQLGKK
jgi:hypothetical protein